MFNSMSPLILHQLSNQVAPITEGFMELVDFNVEGEVLNELSIEVREFFLSSMDATELL